MGSRYPTTDFCDGELLERFEPTTRDSDVFVATAAKCGQTWLQALLFHLKTRGRKPDFDGLGLHGVSPWLEIPLERGYTELRDRDARLEQLEALPDPRVFKLHVLWDEVPRPSGSRARVITITRDPRDLPYSRFSHLHSMERREGSPVPDDFDVFFEDWLEFGFFFRFVASFWPHRNDSDVLWLRYEDLQRDLAGEARRILRFLGWSCSEEDLQRVLPLVDFGYMRDKERTHLRIGNSKLWKSDGRFFREGSVGKNRARLKESQTQRIVERVRRELPPECEAFLFSPLPED